MSYHCSICGYIYDESTQSVPFTDLPEDWRCPICEMAKNVFVQKDDPSAPTATPAPIVTPATLNTIKKIPPSTTEAPPLTSSDSATTSSSINTKSDLFVQQLERNGLRWVFGMVGHSNLGIAEALRLSNPEQQPEKIRFIGIRHEGAAAFAAAAYGKLTHLPAACLSIAGPGATNMSTGIADALLDRAPLLALMGQVPTTTLDQNIFQELKLDACFAPLTKGQYTLHAHSNSAILAKQGYENALTAQAPVQFILPDDTQKHAPLGSEALIPVAHSNTAQSNTIPTAESIQAAADHLSKSKNPLIILGHGAEHALSEARELATLLQSPICTTYRAKGYISDKHPLACGVIGLSGTPISQHFAAEADTLITIGVGYARHSAIPHSDANGKVKDIIRIDHQISGERPLPSISHPLIGDAKATLQLLIEAVKKHPELASTAAGTQSKAERIAQEWTQWRAEKRKRAQFTSSDENASNISPAAICEALNRSLPDNAILSIDVGNVAYQAGRYLESKAQNRYLLSWYLGSIGVGLPAAIGAYAATQEEGPWKNRPIIAIVGDGGLGQYLAEISTLGKYQIPVKIIVFNNSELAKITREQSMAQYPTWETSLINPDFAQLANSCGVYGIRVTNTDELSTTIRQALAHKGPALVDIHCNPNAS